MDPKLPIITFTVLPEAFDQPFIELCSKTTTPFSQLFYLRLFFCQSIFSFYNILAMVARNLDLAV